MNKSVISSEELKRQFAESMPGGIQLFADALNLSTQELLAQVETGKLLAEDVLPKVARQMRIVAGTGGALEQKLFSTRVQQGRFFKQLESDSNLIFRSGFDKGGAEFFKEMTEEMKDSREGLKGLSKMFQFFFKVAGRISQLVMPVLDSMFYVLGKISEGLMYVFQYKTSQIVAGVGAISYAIIGLNTGLIATNSLLALMLKRVLTIVTPLVLAFGILDDLFANFDDQRTSYFEKKAGRQFTGSNSDIGMTVAGMAGQRLLENMPLTGMIMKGKDYFGLGDSTDRTVAGQTNNQPKVVVENSLYVDGFKEKITKTVTNMNSMGSVEGRR